jgi:RNAse (barnase) inhibitor barstar
MNWDAMWDCLTDMLGRPIHIRIIGLDVLEKKFGDTAAKLIDILKELKASENGLFAHEISIEVV